MREFLILENKRYKQLSLHRCDTKINAAYPSRNFRALQPLPKQFRSNFYLL